MPSEPAQPLDLLAIGAHPDDVELFAGGTIALLAKRGRRVGVLALTRGECGTRGTPETRAQEFQAAAKILGAVSAEILDLGDGRLENSLASRKAVVEALRRSRPAVVMTHHSETRHPDHRRAHDLVRDAAFFSHVGGFDAAGERHRVKEIVFFLGHESRSTPSPDWIVDIGETFETKLAAMRAYETQFHHPEKTAAGPQTELTSHNFWANLENSARHWGKLIGAPLGEPYLFNSTPHLKHPFVELFRERASDHPSAPQGHA